MFVFLDKWWCGLFGVMYVVNLVGELISTRWDSKVKGEIMAFWVKIIKVVVEYVNLIINDVKRFKVLVNVLVIGYYGMSEIDTYDEVSGLGADYLS